MSGTVENVNDENYAEFTQAPAAVVAYGIATCEPCKAYDPYSRSVGQNSCHGQIRESQNARAR